MTAPSPSRINELAKEVNSLHPKKIIQFADDDLREALNDHASTALFWQKYIDHKLTQAKIATPTTVAYLSPEQSYNFAVKIHEASVQARTDQHALEVAAKELEAAPVIKGRFTIRKPLPGEAKEAGSISPQSKSNSESSADSQETVTKGRFTITKPKTPSPPPQSKSDSSTESQEESVTRGRFTITKPKTPSPPSSPTASPPSPGAVIKGRFTVTKAKEDEPPSSPSPFRKSP